MSKKGSLLSAAFTGKRKKRGGGLSLSSTWGDGCDNALMAGWGGKSKRGGSGLLPRAFGGRSKRDSLLTPATWEKRKGGTLLVRALGLKDERKRNRGHRLDAVWNKHVRAKRGTLLAIANNARLRGKQNPLLTLFDDKRRGKHKKRKLTGLARSIALMFYSFGRLVSRQTAAVPVRIDESNEPERWLEVELERHITLQAEAQQNRGLLRRVAGWIRERFNSQGPTA